MGRVRTGRARRWGTTVAASFTFLLAAGVAAQDPSSSPGPAAQAGVVSLGATTELLVDDFEPVEGWGLLDRDDTRIEAEDGGLRIRLRATNRSNWTWRRVGDPSAVLRVGATAALDGSGEAGVMCGSTGEDPSFYLGAVTTVGEWVLARIVSERISVIARDRLRGVDLSDGGAARLELECAVTGDGRDRLAFFLDGANIADVTDAASLGAFNRAGLYGGVFEERFEVVFDDAVVLGGDVYEPQVAGAGPDASAGPGPSGSDGSPTPSSAASSAPQPTSAPVPSSPASSAPEPSSGPESSSGPQESSDPQPTGTPPPAASPLPSPPTVTPIPVAALVGAVPESFRAECRTVPGDEAADQLAAVLCVPAGTLDTAEYYRYASVEALDAAFERFLADGGDLTGTDCSAGPSRVEYTTGGRTAGELACYPDPRGGVTFQWTNRELLVLAFGTDAAGVYADAYAWWQDAGPIP